MAKPPAFQFYAKDWLSSKTVRAMSFEDRGVYIDLLAMAWDSEEPGTLTLPVPGYNPRTIRSFLLRWPSTFTPTKSEKESNETPTKPQRELKKSVFTLKKNQKKAEIGLKLENQKLSKQYLNLLEISEKRRKAAESRYHPNAEQMQSKSKSFAHANEQSAFASAFASASETKSSPNNGHPRVIKRGVSPEWEKLRIPKPKT